MLSIDDEIRTLPKIGEKKEKLFQKLNIFTVKDMLFHFPRRYEDRTVYIDIKDIKDLDVTSGVGKIERFEKTYLRSRKTLVTITLSNEGEYFFVKFFNNPYILTKLEIGKKLYFYGKASLVGSRLEFINPEIEFDVPRFKVGKIYPIYPLTKGLRNDEIINHIWYIIDNYDLEIDYIKEQLQEKFKILDLKNSLINIHRPESMTLLKQARYRCIFDEFFKLCVYLQSQRDKRQAEKGIVFKKSNKIKEKIDKLPFTLTNPQQRSLDEILEDMNKPISMKRLLQGDVGSGKTVVAFLSSYNAILNGYQVAFMVPTEILATQHYSSAMEFFKDENINVELLVSGTPKKTRLYEKISSGEVDLVIGTHALIADKLAFDNLGYVITDEQHRFGVVQRETLSRKSYHSPDTLVMTATPIPRTLSLVLHNDMDISTIDKLPEGRKKISTVAFKKNQWKDAYQKVKEQIDMGRQAFIVCPLIEENEKLDLVSAEQLYKDLSTGYFKDYNIDLIHGGMKNKDKNRIMEDFEQNKTSILISTTVIEVGINVPNATVLVINDAQRFGLSQLHQLRGRVGRGSEKSYCILLYEAKTQIANERIKTFVQIDDGFEIAQKDLELRGSGEIFGVRQHGQINFKIADISQNSKILLYAKKCVDYIFENHEENSQLIEKITKTMYSEIIIS